MCFITFHSLTASYCKRDLVFYGIAIHIHPSKFSLKMALTSRNM